MRFPLRLALAPRAPVCGPYGPLHAPQRLARPRACAALWLRRLRSLRAFLKLLESRIVQPLLAREQLLEPWPFRGCNTPHQLLLDLHRPRERMADERTGIVYTLAHVVVQFGPQPSRAEPRAKGRDRDVLVKGSIEPPVCDDIRLCERSRGPSLDAAAGAGGHAKIACLRLKMSRTQRQVYPCRHGDLQDRCIAVS